MWLSVWSKILDFLKKAWDAIKKLPKWAFLAFLLLFSTCWYLFRRVSLEKRKAELKRKAHDLEIKKNSDLVKARGIHKEAGEKIIEKFEKAKESIEEEEKQLNDAISEGPVGIARAWEEYLGGNK